LDDLGKDGIIMLERIWLRTETSSGHLWTW